MRNNQSTNKENTAKLTTEQTEYYLGFITNKSNYLKSFNNTTLNFSLYLFLNFLRAKFLH